MQLEKISVIIATHNSASTLSACLQSVTVQTYNNIEVCIVDGASTDGTLTVIQEWAGEHPTITYISEKDGGVFYAMNKGIEMSTGSWLYFLGSDDELASSTVLAEVLNSSIDADVDLIYGNITGLHTGKEYIINTTEQVITKGISHQGVFYRRRIFNELGKYDTTFKIAADYCLNLKIFLNKKYQTLYIHKDIAKFGERGLSSNHYDYAFYSYYYKFLAQNDGVEYLADPAASLEKSVYCCLYLMQKKEDVSFARENLMYYLLHKNHLSVYNRIKTFFNLLKWSLS